MFRRVLPVIGAGALLFIVSCGPVSDLFRGRDEPPLPGERISILTLEEKFIADPALVSSEIILPEAIFNPNWPQAGGNPTHVMKHVFLPEDINSVWKKSIGAGSSSSRRLTASPVVSDGKIFTMDTMSKISAISISDGTEVWQKIVSPAFEERGALGGGIASDGGILYVSTAYGEIQAINAQTGQLLWELSIGVPIRGAPTVSGGRVFVLSHDNQLHAVDSTTGELLWKHFGIREAAGLVIGASVAVGLDLVISPYTSGEIFALRPENGRVVWSDSLSRTGRLNAMAEINDIAGLPVLDGNFAFVVGRGGRMVSIDIRSGIRIWQLDLTSVQSPWVAENIIFVVSVNGDVLAISKDSGRIYWVTELQKFEDEKDREHPIQWLGPVLAGNKLILASSHGEIIFLSPYDGSYLDTIELNSGISVAPIVADSTLFLLTENAVLHAFR